jgi:hypothetical protein
MLNALTLAVALLCVANCTGWIFTEIGRAPWVIFGLQKIERAVSPDVSASSVAASLAVFVALYLGIAAVVVYLLPKFVRAGIGDSDVPEHQDRPRGSDRRWGRSVGAMGLNTVWFALTGVLFAGYFILEGFDFGVGILLPFLGSTDAGRRRIVDSIGFV